MRRVTMSESTKALFLVVVIALCFLSAGTLWAQASHGTISGRIMDPSGSVIPGAEVTAVQKLSNFTSTTISTSNGYFELLRLGPGRYRLSVEAPGFKTSVVEDVELRIQENVRLDVTMEIGEVADSVVVESTAPLLDTASASLGTVIDMARIENLPLGHGNPTFLMYLAPGVVMSSLGRSTQRMQRAATANVRIAGSPAGTTEYLLDGAPNTQQANGQGGVSVNPMSDVVGEMKVQMGNFDASVGHGGGTKVNLSLKSGTNDYHGTAYKYYRSPRLTANDFFSNKAGLPLADFKYERFGFSAGGPVRIPGLYNGKDRTFFMWGFDYWSQIFPNVIVGSVPTAKEIAGDFSELLALGSQYQIYDPSTIQPTGTGRFSAQPFPGNVIPAARLSPIARKLAELWPAPNQPGTKDGLSNYAYRSDGGNARTDYATTVRIDHQLTSSHRLSGSAIISENTTPSQTVLGKEDIVAAAVTGIPRHYSLEDTWVINPLWVANIRLSNMRFSWLNVPKGAGMDQAELGFDSKVLNLITNTKRLPQITLSDFDFIGTSGDGYNITDTWSVGSDLSRIRGAHSFKFGADLRRYFVYEGKNPVLSLTFSPSYTRGPLDNSPTAPVGQGLAAMLLGIPSSGNITLEAQTAERVLYQGFYFHDDWKVTPKLTLSLGLRYEREAPLAERYGQSVRGFDFASPSPIAAQAEAKYASAPIPQVPVDQFKVTGGVLFAGVGGQPKNLYDADNNNFQPRIGFAYRPAQNTVIRGGYGVFMLPLGQRFKGIVPVPLGFSQATNVIPTLDNGQTFIASLADPLPNGLTAPTGSKNGLLTNIGQSITFFPSRLLNPYNQLWQVSIQQEWAKTLFEIGYVGNRTTKMINTRNINSVPNAYLSTSPERDQATIDLLTKKVTNPFAGLLPGTSLNSTTIGLTQLLLPYPHFSSISTWNNQGYSYYHALRVQVERRMRQGFTVMGSFNWSKLMEATSYLNPTDPVPYKQISAQDAPTTFTTSAIYELPFGPNKLLGGGTHGVLGHILEGWQIQGLVEMQAGFPLSWGNIIFRGDVNDIPISNATYEKGFNTEAGFERASAKQLANNVRTFPERLAGVRAQDNVFLDLSLSKRTRVRESVSVMFYLEAFNAFNHAVFRAPNTSPTSSAFGASTQMQNIPREVQLGLKLIF